MSENIKLPIDQAFKSPEIKKKVDELINKMTLEEKIGQMTQLNYRSWSEERMELVRKGKVGSLLKVYTVEEANKLQKMVIEETRLGIPLLIGNDVIHGCRTIFPIPLAEASSWDPELAEETAAIAAKETSTLGTQWIFAPMVDIARDPRWGRIAEGAGEDTYLGSAMAAARVKGLQRNDWDDRAHIVACPKHFAAYGLSEGGRDYNIGDVSEKTLREVYLPPFKSAIDAGAGTIMSAYLDLNGIPASANSFLLKTILRDELGFEGFVVTDWETTQDLIKYGVAADGASAVQKAANAGADMDMNTLLYNDHLARLVEEGKVSEEVINNAVRRILAIKFWLGLFEHPYVNTEYSKNIMMCESHMEKALEAAQKSIVLLKNENELLPLDKDAKSIAVIGPFANNQKDPLGCWKFKGLPKETISLLSGIKSKVSSDTKIMYAKGCDVAGNSMDGFAAALETAKKCDVAIVALGEDYDMSGECKNRASLDLPGVQQQLLQAIYDTGTPVVLVLMNGRPLSITWANDFIPSIIEAWQLGTQCGNAIANVLFGDYNPSGKLPVTFPRTVGQVPIYYNHRISGGPKPSGYVDMPSTPLYPFGYGLSYTKFEYSNLQFNSQTIQMSESLKVTVDVKNIGQKQGDEIVQLYIRDVVAGLTRPVKELKGFKRISLKPSETKTVEFMLSAEQLGYYSEDMQYVVDAGLFKVWVGPNSAEGMEGSFEIK